MFFLQLNCPGAKTAALVGGAADIRVDDAWIKPFPDAPAVAYAALTNTGDNPGSINTGIESLFRQIDDGANLRTSPLNYGALLALVAIAQLVWSNTRQRGS